MQQMGGLGGLMGMLPGARKAKQAMESANLDDNVLKRQEAIISSMTKAERAKPALLNASRRKRIAAGSGTSVQEVNKLLKMHQQMAGMMKKMRTKGGMKNLLGAAQQAGISQADLAKMGGQQLPGLGGGAACRRALPLVGFFSIFLARIEASAVEMRAEYCWGVSKVNELFFILSGAEGHRLSNWQKEMTDIDTTLAKFQLNQFRDSIDNLDAILVHTLADAGRFKLTQQVGKLKAQHNLPPADKTREAEQIERLRQMAQESGLDPAFAEKFLNFIVAEVIRHHEHIRGLEAD